MLESIRPVAREIRRRGGRALVAGGYVRDLLLGCAGEDLDVEVLGLTPSQLDEALGRFGTVLRFGSSFPVRQVEGVRAQFSLPRRDSLPVDGPEEEGAASLSFAEAARRRDLTVNAMGLDPLTEEILDPLGGRADLEAGRLRAADPARFGDDPLRGLRVMQLAARLEMRPDAELLELCGRLDLEAVPGERWLPEFDKLLLRAPRPSLGLAVLRQTKLLHFFPELAALVGVPQDPEWHPEGDVWRHTLLALDAAAALRGEGRSERDAELMHGVLCHDLGKPATTREIDGRMVARGHTEAGVERARRFLARMRASNERIGRVCALVAHHLAPALLDAQGAGARAYRRLARKLAAADVTPDLLERVARADHLGRTTADARARRFAAGDRFLARMAELELRTVPPDDVVRGRHLIARGIAPGPELGAVLERCRDVQDETGSTDAEEILARVLGEPERRE